MAERVARVVETRRAGRSLSRDGCTGLACQHDVQRVAHISGADDRVARFKGANGAQPGETIQGFSREVTKGVELCQGLAEIGSGDTWRTRGRGRWGSQGDRMLPVGSAFCKALRPGAHAPASMTTATARVRASSRHPRGPGTLRRWFSPSRRPEPPPGV